MFGLIVTVFKSLMFYLLRSTLYISQHAVSTYLLILCACAIRYFLKWRPKLKITKNIAQVTDIVCEIILRREVRFDGLTIIVVKLYDGFAAAVSSDMCWAR